jgi:hypothetical protein
MPSGEKPCLCVVWSLVLYTRLMHVEERHVGGGGGMVMGMGDWEQHSVGVGAEEGPCEMQAPFLGVLL